MPSTWHLGAFQQEGHVMSEAEPRDVQGSVRSELSLLDSYHDIILAQSRRCFFWALIGAGIGTIGFAIAVALALSGSWWSTMLPTPLPSLPTLLSPSWVARPYTFSLGSRSFYTATLRAS
jgi:hypothetical protein